MDNGLNRIYVEDNDVGFYTCYIHKLYNVFQPLHKQNEIEGIGVSLTIVQIRLRKQRGIIWSYCGLGASTGSHYITK